MILLDSKLLLDEQITWCHNAESGPAMQAMALNTINAHYPSKDRRFGYMLHSKQPNHDDALPEACYYLIERTTDTEDGFIGNCLIAFKENGDHLEGYAIFKDSDEYFRLLEASEISDEDLAAAAGFMQRLQDEKL